MLRERIEKALDDVRLSLQEHGGDIEFVDVDSDGIVQVSLKGNCASCGFSQMTVKGEIEKRLKLDVPEVKQVIAIKRAPRKGLPPWWGNFGGAGIRTLPAE
jgi:Fe-S cluster biogenesis protein NfuA